MLTVVQNSNNFSIFVQKKSTVIKTQKRTAKPKTREHKDENIQNDLMVITIYLNDDDII